jgi:hypothetical protein
MEQENRIKQGKNIHHGDHGVYAAVIILAKQMHPEKCGYQIHHHPPYHERGCKEVYKVLQQRNALVDEASVAVEGYLP